MNITTDTTFSFNKDVDWSLLNYGFNIRLEYQDAFYSKLGRTIHHGESMNIQIVINGETFVAVLNNIGFDRSRYSNHKDMLQVRYSSSSPIARKFQSIFSSTYSYYLSERRLKDKNDRRIIRVPDEMKEYAFISYVGNNVLSIDYETRADYVALSNFISETKLGEESFEMQHFENVQDKSATMEQKEMFVKVRKLDRSICDSLKKLYDFRCQITGEKIGESFDGLVIEAHHIEPFVTSMNNDSNNIIILSPNFHRIVHKCKPFFNRKKLQFEFENGVIENVKINKHL